jgi:tyrosine-specific transport protein
MKIFHSMGHVVGGSLLIAGTSIGVGMLAMPVATGSSGLLPAASIYIICWLFIISTALLIVEVSLSMPPDTSFISMGERLLGPVGKGIFWATYLFLFLAVMIAHIVGGGAVLLDILGTSFPSWAWTILYVVAIAAIVYLGTHAVDRINMVLISGVILSYFAFIAVSYEYVDTSLLTHANWNKAWIALPILFTAFTFQVILPTLMTYMKRNVRNIRLAIFIGSSIPLVVYLVWELLILGILPHQALAEAAAAGKNAVEPLKYYVQSPTLNAIGKTFAFFAMTTSFVPLALSFFDFLADGLKMKKKGTSKNILIVAIFIVPLIVALIYPNVFLIALGYAGGISCAFLFGLMPPLLAWICRYLKRYPIDRRQLPGGKTLLAFLMLFAFLILAGEVLQHLIS